MRKYALIAALLLTTLPASAALAGGRHYDRGDRYRGGGWGHRSRSSFDFSIGFGSDNWRSGFSYRHHDYPRHRSYGHRHYSHYSPPVVYYRPIYTPPPVVIYPTPRYYHYDSCPAPSYYSETRYYYGR